MNRLPQNISDYLKQRFREEFLIDVQKFSKNGQVIYKIKVNENQLIHHLDFTEGGKLIKSRIETLYTEDDHQR